MTRPEQSMDEWDEMAIGLECNHDVDGLCTVCIATALRQAAAKGREEGYRAGQERMRDRAIMAFYEPAGNADREAFIEALPTEDEPTS